METTDYERMKRFSPLPRARGFTLIELAVVIVIIAVIAGIALPTFLRQRERATDRAMISDLVSANKLAFSYYMDRLGGKGSFTGFDPDSEQEWPSNIIWGAPLADGQISVISTSRNDRTWTLIQVVQPVDTAAGTIPVGTWVGNNTPDTWPDLDTVASHIDADGDGVADLDPDVTTNLLTNNPTQAPTATAVELPGPPDGTAWATISAGVFHTCGVTTSGAAYCWGGNWDGQLGNGSTDDYSTPQPVLGGHSWTTISAGVFHTCGVTTAETAYCWGYGSSGQLGNGSTDDYSTPQLVSGVHSWATISAGSGHTCGVTTDGAGYCWGYGDDGQLGNGSTDDYSTPQPVLGGHSWTTISAGDYHTCGVTDSGAGYCWGDGSSGQLGNGSTDDYSTPQLVSGGHTWATISAGAIHSCGVTTSETGYCWGYGDDGQLGNGSTDDYSTPQLVSGGHTWTTISAGVFHTCGVTTAETGYCWGDSGEGQLGNGDTSAVYTEPSLVSGGHSWATISAGSGYTCGVTTSETGYCWGYGDDGQLGNGSTDDYSTPQPVVEP